MVDKEDISTSEETGDSHGLSERLDRISLGLRRLRIGEESPQAGEYHDMGKGHFVVLPKGAAKLPNA